MQKVIAKINLKAISDNARVFRKLTGVKLCAVVKADAYGHGAEAVACALSGEADMFAVALLDEGKAIRTAACGKPVLVLTPPTDAEEARELVENGFIASVPDLGAARLLAEAAERRGGAAVHLQANTGMNRYGMNLSSLGRVCGFLKEHPSVRVEGLYSHLYTHSREESEKQRRLFVRMKEICGRYFPGVCCHLSATYGALLGREFAFDMVRIGLGLYGYLPDGGKEPRLRKAMKVYARAIQSRRYSFGGAGYGFLDGEEAASLGDVGVLRAGYADGFFRKRENGMRGSDRNLSPLCMDACIRRGRSRAGAWVPVMTDADETAAVAGTISYEILCSVTRRAEFSYEYK